MDATVLAGLPVGLVEVDEAGSSGEDQPDRPDKGRHVRAVVDPEQIQDERHREDPHRKVREQRMQRVAEPRPVEEAPEPFGPEDEAVNGRVEVRDPETPVPFVEDRADESTDHGVLPRRTRDA